MTTNARIWMQRAKICISWFFIFFTSFGMDLRKLKFCGKKISGDFCVRDCEDTA